jgi:transposase
VQRDPHLCGCERARWRRCDLRERLPWLAGRSLSTISRVLRRCGLRLKRGRIRVHSPDPAYVAKRDEIVWALGVARHYPRQIGLYYADEASLHRQPSLADRWGVVGDEPTAEHAARFDSRQRLCAALDATSGRVTWIGGSHMTVPRICAFLRAIRAADPDRVLLLVWDNWPVHHHPRVRAEAARLRIEFLWLPTYAPWLNPIEKLWRLCRQTVVHHHRLAHQWPLLKAHVTTFLDTFAAPSPALLRYTGLSD